MKYGTSENMKPMELDYEAIALEYFNRVFHLNGYARPKSRKIYTISILTSEQHSLKISLIRRYS